APSPSSSRVLIPSIATPSTLSAPASSAQSAGVKAAVGSGGVGRVGETPNVSAKTKKSAGAAAFWNSVGASDGAAVPAWARGVDLNGGVTQDSAPPPPPTFSSGPLGTSVEPTSAYTALGPPVVEAPVSSTAPGSRLRMWLRRPKGGADETGSTDQRLGTSGSASDTIRVASTVSEASARWMDASSTSMSLLNAGTGLLGTGTADESGPRLVPMPRTLPRARVNWRRTLAASGVVALLEGAAFGAAYWYVVPNQTGSLLVETTPAGIDIIVDGRVSGRTPFFGALVPGRHTIE